MDTHAMTFEVVRVNELRPHPQNPRKGDVKAIRKSIEANGFYGAVIAQMSETSETSETSEMSETCKSRNLACDVEKRKCLRGAANPQAWQFVYPVRTAA